MAPRLVRFRAEDETRPRAYTRTQTSVFPRRNPGDVREAPFPAARARALADGAAGGRRRRCRAPPRCGRLCAATRDALEPRPRERDRQCLFRAAAVEPDPRACAPARGAQRSRCPAWTPARALG